MVMEPDTTVNLAGITLKNPVMSASGTFGYGQEYVDFVPPESLGAVVTKGISLKPRQGNPPPRIVETPAGMLNAIGLENVGLDAFVRDKLPWLKDRGAVVVANIYGETVDEYARVAEGLGRTDGVSLLELNVSCPNVAAGGMAFGSDPEAVYQAVKAVVQAGGLPVMVKLTPMVTDIVTIARAAVEAGGAALSLINTIPGMAVDLERRRPKLANVIGGLSGPAIKPVALRLCWQVAQNTDVPVVGVGGIANARDALEFILVGAAAVQVGTAGFINPFAAVQIIDEIREYMRNNKMRNLDQIRGQLHKRFDRR
jgi:dihydroorotate dehydrogenase (NAD+) catalytic subunit